MRLLMLLVLVTACSSKVMSPDLSLADRFVLTALTDDDGSPLDEMWKWTWPIRLQVTGDQTYRSEIERQALELGRIIDQPVFLDQSSPNMRVEVSNRDTPSTCQFELYGRPNSFRTEIHILLDQPRHNIRQCISQELTQSLGIIGDLDGVFGSRQDTVFASYGGALELTDADRQLLTILYDPRLWSGMPRAEVLEILPAIVADVEAEQAAGR